MSLKVLTNPDRDRELDDRAFVQIPLLDAATVQRLKEGYWSLAPSGEDGIRLEFLRSDRSIVAAMHELAMDIAGDAITGLFHRHYPVYASFVVKHPGADSDLYLHRDLAVDDERQRRTYAVWIALDDTSPEHDNGVLGFLPGSERFRYGGYGPNATVYWDPYHRWLYSRLRPVTATAGDALVYDGRMLHASDLNRTNAPRMALGCLMAHRDYAPTQVVATGRRHRRLYQVDSSYFVDFQPSDVAVGGMPDRFPLLDEWDEEPPYLPAAIFGAALSAADIAEMAGAREAVVAEDLAHRVDPDLTVETGVPVVFDHTQDVVVTADQVDPHARGGVGIRSLGGAWAEGWSDVDVPGIDGIGHAAGLTRLVVLDRGARTTLPIADAASLVCVEATPTRAGVIVRRAGAATGALAELDIGTSLRIPARSEVDLWNDGPGVLVVVVALATPASDDYPGVDSTAAAAPVGRAVV